MKCVELSITEVAEEGTIDLLPQPRHFAFVLFLFNNCCYFLLCFDSCHVFIADDRQRDIRLVDLFEEI